MLANNETVMGEMERRGHLEHGFKQLYVDCNACGRRIILETYTGKAILTDRKSEKLRCPECHNESAYSSDDFKTST
jgi:ribosomal protein S27E